MKALSKSIYDLISLSKVEIISVKEKYKSFPEQKGSITIYKFLHDLEHLVRAGIFSNVEWTCSTTENGTMRLISDVLDGICGTYVEVEIIPVGDMSIDKVETELKGKSFADLLSENKSK